ncbi:unnamed protein product, partial [Ectocarpus sp. 12 AP-2014]
QTSHEQRAGKPTNQQQTRETGHQQDHTFCSIDEMAALFLLRRFVAKEYTSIVAARRCLLPTTTTAWRRPSYSTAPPSSSSVIFPRTRSELVGSLPPVYPSDLAEAIRKDVAAVGRMLVVLDDDPTGTQSVHSVPVLAEWSVDILVKELRSPGRYRVMYLNTNARALPPTEASELFEEIAKNLQQACRITGVEVSMVSRGDSTLRGHFPSDLVSLETGMRVQHDAWIVVPFFKAGGRITAGDVHFVEQQGTTAATPPGSGTDSDDDAVTLVPAGETEFARDKAFGYRSSNLVDWIREKASVAEADEGRWRQPPAATERVVSVSLRDLREGGPPVVRERLGEAKGGCVVVNAVEERDLQVFVKGMLEEELEGKRFLFRSAADLVAVRGAVDRRPLLATEDFDALRVKAGEAGSEGGLTVVGSYVAKTTEQLQHSLEAMDAEGVELRAAEVVGEGQEGIAASRQEVERVRAEVSLLLSRGTDVILYTSRGVPLQGDGAGGLVFGERVGAALVACVSGLTERPRFLLSKGGITSSDVATQALAMKRAEVMGQILPGVPVWSMADDSRWPGLPLVVFPGNVGGKEALAEAMIKLGARPKSDRSAGGHHTTAPVQHKREVLYPYAGGSGRCNRTLDVLAEARGRGAAVGAFTVYNLEGIHAVIRAAEATGRSAILQAHPAALGFQRGIPLLSAAVLAARTCGKSGGPLLAVQLDHGTDEDHVTAALEAGVDSVMIDGSAMDYEENVEWTARMAELAHGAGAAVEAELGKLAGEEDGLSVPEVEAKMTDPKQVPDFLARTKADILAVTVGNVHGRYARPDPRLDLARLGLVKAAATGASPSMLLSS